MAERPASGAARAAIAATKTWRVGDAVVRRRSLGADDINAFAALVGDDNPIHTDTAAARAAGFDAPIAQGMLVSSLISEILGNELPGPGVIYLEQTLKFLAPVLVGEVFELRVEVEAVRGDQKVLTLRTTCIDTGGRLCVDGRAVMLRRSAVAPVRDDRGAP